MLRQRRLPARAGDRHVSGRRAAMGIEITTRSGRRIVSTPEHTHFAGYQRGYTPAAAPDVPDVAPRQGLPRRDDADLARRASTSRCSGLSAARAGARGRRLGASSTHDTEAEARGAGARCSRSSTASRRCRSSRAGREPNGLVARPGADRPRLRQRRHRRHGCGACSREHGLDFDHRTTSRAPSRAARRNVTITLCGDRRGRTPMHLVAVGGRDAEARERARAARALASARRRPARRAGATSPASRTSARAMASSTGSARDCRSRPTRRAARRAAGGANTLPFTPRRVGAPGHGDVHRGRRLRRRRVASSASRSTAPVYDLNVEDTHNFVADGLVTHNSIYGFRGADIQQHPGFRGRLPRRPRRQARAELPLDADDPRRRQRGHRQQPRARWPSTLWTDIGEGDPIQVRELADEHAEARFVAARDRAAGRRGRRRAPRSPSSTGRTRSRGCSRTCSCGRRSATR